jgi:hypothetical protein
MNTIKYEYYMINRKSFKFKISKTVKNILNQLENDYHKKSECDYLVNYVKRLNSLIVNNL